MAPTEAHFIAPLTPGAMPGCLALSAEAGWNQAAEDWDLFFRHGRVFGVLEAGSPLATGAILPFPDGGFGWVSMVLVAGTKRGRGLGTAILRRCMAALEAQGLRPVLDATPAGERIYRPLGFQPQLGLTRWRGQGGGEAPEGVRQLSTADLPALTDTDAKGFGAARGFVLEALLGRAAAQAFGAAGGSGFVLARPGRQALQIGPLVAEDEAGAIRLLDAALAATRGPVLMDLADRWPGFAAHLRERGFTPERPFNRMALKRAEPFGTPSRVFLVAGPELG
ncbi:Acetyltransferase (GNAT) domain-containing protein [Roseomonas rosea]|uniref:Acetyltransferase (GNAT) domain-containing protein n=1 Tax=Muricoccus roseus TaxID=198092 RepID=A0A1M6HQZ8_9PROT|nr:GNAT family N-acetyltransferase [Roseomonas rosea]SHJ24514.1 Acetyltransferase (GNAT) domain-containing protein [Roseomonas rosea]